MSLDGAGLLAAVTSHAQALGLFERVNKHEPKNAPGNGLTAAVWVQRIEPIKKSGLDKTSGRIELSVRIFTSMLAEPQDGIDPNMIAAADALLAAYSGDFELGGNLQVREIDLLGEHGVPLSAQAGYIEQDRKQLRVMTITLPLIVNDIWNQEA